MSDRIEMCHTKSAKLTQLMELLRSSRMRIDQFGILEIVRLIFVNADVGHVFRRAAGAILAQRSRIRSDHVVALRLMVSHQCAGLAVRLMCWRSQKCAGHIVYVGRCFLFGRCIRCRQQYVRT